jgi:hypothetical protein
MAWWNGEVRDESGRTKSTFSNVSFADVKAKVFAKKPGEYVTFMPPIEAPGAEIDELVRMGARKTLP